MPQMGLEVTEGTVAAIHVAVGARVAEGDPLLELETDKALTDVVAPRDGVVRALEVEVGDTVEIGATLVLLADGDADADEAPVPARDEAPAAGDAAEQDAAEQDEAEAVPVAAATTAGRAARTEAGRIRAAPVARRAAERLGVALAEITGTGPRGRITLRDVEQAAAASNGNGAGRAPAPPPPAAAGERLEPMSATRRAVARRMTLSQQIPQFALVREIDATWLLAQKDRIAADNGVKAGVNDLLVQALAEAVLRHPDLAASFVAGEDGGPPRVRRRDGVDVGLAVATDRGLVVPVIRGAHERPLQDIAADRGRLVGAARSGRLTLEEMTGATVTLSNLGSFGVDRFTAMINPGESAILAVGRVVERVVPRGRGTAVVPTLTLTLTIDHRVADGATGAAALVELADLLEGAMTWRP